MRRRLARRVFPFVVVFVVFLFLLNHFDADINNDVQNEELRPQNFSNLKISFEKEVYDGKNVETDMKARRLEMTKACHDFGLDVRGNDSLHKPNPWEYLINKKHKLVWCNVFKSGSSSWMYIFNRLTGLTDRDLKSKTRRTPPVTLARSFYPRPSTEELLEAMKNSISFIVARHPFERLVSGYRDKILAAFRGSFHEKLGRSIIQKYRNIDPKHLGHSGSKMRPTFTEFVRFILDEVNAGSSLDMHWTPVYSFCNPCQVNFSHIVKFETFERDQLHIIKLAEIEHMVGAQRENSAKDGKRSVDLMLQYLAELPKDVYANLIKIYEIDFKLFGYEIPAISN